MSKSADLKTKIQENVSSKVYFVRWWFGLLFIRGQIALKWS